LGTSAPRRTFNCRPGEGWRLSTEDGERIGSLVRQAWSGRPPGPSSGDKGRKKNAIGFVSSLVIGVALTAPGYSLAATLGFIAAAVALQSPAVLLISFIPMFLGGVE
jgi:hypothetical protein